MKKVILIVEKSNGMVFQLEFVVTDDDDPVGAVLNEMCLDNVNVKDSIIETLETKVFLVNGFRISPKE